MVTTQPFPLGANCTNKTDVHRVFPQISPWNGAEISRFPSCATMHGGFPKPQVVSSSLAGGTSVLNGLAPLATSGQRCSRNHRGASFPMWAASVRTAFFSAIAYLERTKVAA